MEGWLQISSHSQQLVSTRTSFIVAWSDYPKTQGTLDKSMTEEDYIHSRLPGVRNKCRGFWNRIDEEFQIQSFPRKFDAAGFVDKKWSSYRGSLLFSQLWKWLSQWEWKLSIHRRLWRSGMGQRWKKHDGVVGDATGCGRNVLWENDVEHLKEKQSCKLACIAVHSF